MLYSFARVSAVIGMRRQDNFRQESRGWLRLDEKGGKRHDVPAHHRAAEAGSMLARVERGPASWLARKGSPHGRPRSSPCTIDFTWAISSSWSRAGRREHR